MSTISLCVEFNKILLTRAVTTWVSAWSKWHPPPKKKWKKISKKRVLGRPGSSVPPEPPFWRSCLGIPGSTKLGPILFAHAVRAWANVVVTQGIAQGVSNIGPSLGRVRKQYWAKIVHNFATRGCTSLPATDIQTSIKVFSNKIITYCIKFMLEVIIYSFGVYV